MPSEQTESSRYPSRYSPDKYITAAQLICEVVCENRAGSKNSALPIRFWTLPEWAKFYKQQIPAANKLLARYEAKVIIAALQSYEGKRIYSLRARHLLPIIEQEVQKLLGKRNKVIPTEITYDSLPPRLRERIERPDFGEKSNLEKLKDLD